MKKKKAIILAVVFVAVVVVLNNLFNFLLIQPGLARTMFHECKKGGNECVILGASHGSYGISTQDFEEQTGMNTMNMCIGGEYMHDAYHTLKYAIKKNKLSTVVLDIDYQYLLTYSDSSILNNNVYNAYPSDGDKLSYFVDKIACEDYRGAFLPWTNYWQCYYMIGKTVKKKLSREYREYSASVVDMNENDRYMGKGFVAKSRKASKAKTEGVNWDRSKISSKQCEYIRKIVELCRKNNIKIIFTTMPVDPATFLHNTNKFSDVDKYISEMADELGVEYYNFNYLKFSVFPRDTNDFWDCEGHMYEDTAKRFSVIYGQVIEKALSGNLNRNDYFADSLKTLYSPIATWQN